MQNSWCMWGTPDLNSNSHFQANNTSTELYMPLHLLRDSPAIFLQIFSHPDTLMLLWHPKLKTGRVHLLVESSAHSCVSHLASYLRVHSIHPWYCFWLHHNPPCHLYEWPVSFFLGHHVSLSLSYLSPPFDRCRSSISPPKTWQGEWITSPFAA